MIAHSALINSDTTITVLLRVDGVTREKYLGHKILFDPARSLWRDGLSVKTKKVQLFLPAVESKPAAIHPDAAEPACLFFRNQINP
jgi:hypothetical protein